MTENAPKSIRSASIAIGCVAFLFAGCAGPAVPETRPIPTAVVNAAATPFDALRKGMTAAEVRALVGEPKETRPFPAGGSHSHVWTYDRTVSESAQLVAVGTQEIPSIASSGARMSGLQEPVYQSETIVVVETIELLMIDDRLIEWKRSRQTQHLLH